MLGQIREEDLSFPDFYSAGVALQVWTDEALCHWGWQGMSLGGMQSNDYQGHL